MSYAGPGWMTVIVNAISADLVARGMAYAGLDPLTPDQDGGAGRIFFGPQYVAEQTAPNRVVCEVVGGDWGPRDLGLLCIAGDADPDFRAAWLSRPLASVGHTFRFHCWASAATASGTTSTPEADFDATIALTKAVMRSILQVVPGCDERSAIVYTNSAQADAASLERTGWKSTFSVRIPIPLEDYPLNYAPTGSAPLFVLPQT